MLKKLSSSSLLLILSSCSGNFDNATSTLETSNSAVGEKECIEIWKAETMPLNAKCGSLYCSRNISGTANVAGGARWGYDTTQCSEVSADSGYYVEIKYGQIQYSNSDVGEKECIEIWKAETMPLNAKCGSLYCSRSINGTTNVINGARWGYDTAQCSEVITDSGYFVDIKDGQIQ